MLGNAESNDRAHHPVDAGNVLDLSQRTGWLSQSVLLLGRLLLHLGLGRPPPPAVELLNHF
jgi:hypothetical protein